MKKKNLLITTIAIFGLATITLAQVPSYLPTNGLVGWWPFNGNANDESGNGNNGTVNGAILTSDRMGNLSNAYSFDGVSDFIQCLNSGPSGSGPITLSFWYYSNSDSTQTVFSYGGINWGTLFDASINWKPSGSGPCFGPSFVAEGTGISWGSIETQALSWHHVVIIVPESSTDCTTLIINVDGQIASTCSFANYGAPNLNFGNSNPIQIGKSHSPNIGVGNSNFNGKIDDIGIWNRALTQEEISNLYNATNCSNNLTISPAINQLQTGGLANFIATTSDLNPSYVWQSDFGQGYVTLNNYGNYSGVNTNSLSISNVQLSEHNQPIRVISTSGECIDTSNVATINITDTCTITINDTITTLISVTDTLVINTIITGLTPPNNLNTIKVFPNPANSHITIDFGNFESMNGYTLTITNSIGQTVYTTPINEQSSYVDLSTWGGNGIYFVQVIDTQNNTIENRKIVLQ